MTVYVQSANSNTWHWCKNCEEYPSNIDETTEKRPKQNLCPKCYHKDKNRDCEGQDYTYPPGILFSD